MQHDNKASGNMTKHGIYYELKPRINEKKVRILANVL